MKDHRVISSGAEDEDFLTFGGHLDVLRRMLMRTSMIVVVVGLAVFAFKDEVFNILLFPCHGGLIPMTTDIKLIATDISTQFVAHISMSIYVGLLISSPYVMYELFRIVSPALYDNERRYSITFTIILYVLFILGVVLSYFVIFPFSCQFLANYSVSQQVTTMVTLDSYLSMFISMSLTMGVVFELPIVSFLLAKWGLLAPSTMRKYRRHAFVIILLLAAIITPPDATTLFLMSIPLYVLYEISVIVVSLTDKHK